jgi:hypothetical protein
MSPRKVPNFPKSGKGSEMDMIATVDGFMLGAAGLALWVVARYPSLGPRSIVSCLALIVGASLALSVTTSATGRAVEAVGPAGALFFFVLPALTFGFWAWACFARALVGLLGASRR